MVSGVIMMGYRDPNAYDDEGLYWDDFIAEFGVEAYVEVRYLEWQKPTTS